MRFDHNRFENTCFPQIFEHTVEQFPQHTALYWITQQDEINAISYEALNRRSNQLAHYLKNTHTIQQNQKIPIIAVCLERGPNSIICLLAIWKAGFIYQPLDPNEATSGLNLKIKQSRCVHILHDYKARQKFPSHIEDLQFTNLEDSNFQITLAEYPQENPQNIRKITDEAYLLASSGTEGMPKMIMNTFEGLPGRITGFLSYIHLEPNSSVLGFSEYHFDASLMDIFLAFSTSSALFIVPSYAQKDILGELHRLLSLAKEKHINITYAALIPKVINLIDPDQFLFKYLITMGDKSNWSHLKKLIERGTKVFDGYGPTETTIAATIRELTLESPVGIAEISPSTKKLEGALPEVILGLVKKEEERYILVKDTEGGEGEIILGGKGVGYYWNNDALNQKQFIEFPELGQGRFYLTGDIAQYNRGVLQISGRNNREIKVHGIKINLDSLEKNLEDLSEIQQAAVTQVNASIVCFVALCNGLINSNAMHNIREQQNIIFKGLSTYLFTVNKIPETHNKKSRDYRALTDINQKDLERTLVTTGTFTPYLSKLESDIGTLCANIFTDKAIVSLSDSDFQISRDQSLTSLGADSIHLSQLYHQLWTQLVTRKEGKFYPTLYFKKQLMEADTIEKLATAIEQQNHESLLTVQEGTHPYLYLFNMAFKETTKFECGIYQVNLFSHLDEHNAEQITEEIIDIITQHQKVGPYHIAMPRDFSEKISEQILKKFNESRPEENIFITPIDSTDNLQKLNETIHQVEILKIETQLLQSRKREFSQFTLSKKTSDYQITTNQNIPKEASQYLRQFINHEIESKILFLTASIELEPLALIKNLLTDDDHFIYINVANQESIECILKHLDNIGVTEKNKQILKNKKITILVDNYEMMNRYDHPNLWDSNQLNNWEHLNLIIVCNHSLSEALLKLSWNNVSYLSATLSHKDIEILSSEAESPVSSTPLTLDLIPKHSEAQTSIPSFLQKRCHEQFLKILKKHHLNHFEYSFSEFISYAKGFLHSFPTQYDLDFSGSYWEDRYDHDTTKKYQDQLDSKYFKILRYFIVNESSNFGSLEPWFKNFLQLNDFAEKQEKDIYSKKENWNFLDFFECKSISENTQLPPVFFFCPLSNELPLTYYDVASSLAETHLIIVVTPLETQPTWEYEYKHSLLLQSRLIADYLIKNYPDCIFTLAGWSFGGIQAFAVAQAIESLGRSIHQLITIDSPAITTVTQMPLRDRSAAVILAISTTLYSAPGAEELESKLMEWKNESDPKSLFLLACKHLEAHATTTDSRTQSLIQKLNACYLNLMAEYEFAEHLNTTRLELLKAPHHSLTANISSPAIGNSVENIQAWSTLCNNHDYKMFPGDHFNLFTSALIHYLSILIRTEREISQIMYPTNSRIFAYLYKIRHAIKSETMATYLPLECQEHTDAEIVKLSTTTLNECIYFCRSDEIALGVAGPAGSGKSTLIAMLGAYLADNTLFNLQKKSGASMHASEMTMGLQKTTPLFSLEQVFFPIMLDHTHKSSQSIKNYLLDLGFSQSDIETLSGSMQFILLLDDIETASYSIETLLSDIKLKYPLKILMCARSEGYNKPSQDIYGLFSKYEKFSRLQQKSFLFTPFKYTIRQICLNLLTEEAVNNYILHINKSTPLSFKSYQELAQQYPLLKMEVLTPLSLYLFMSAFKFNATHPSTEKPSFLTATDLYRPYLDTYYHEYYNLLKRFQGIPNKENLKEMLDEYQYQLALKLHRYRFPKVQEEYQSFLHHDPITHTLSHLSPIRIENDKVQFIHQTFEEYLIAERIFKTLLKGDSKLLQQERHFNKENDGAHRLIFCFLLDLLVNHLSCLQSQGIEPLHKNLLYAALASSVMNIDCAWFYKNSKAAYLLFKNAYGENLNSFTHSQLLLQSRLLGEKAKNKIEEATFFVLIKQMRTTGLSEIDLALFEIYDCAEQVLKEAIISFEKNHNLSMNEIPSLEYKKIEDTEDESPDAMLLGFAAYLHSDPTLATRNSEPFSFSK